MMPLLAGISRGKTWKNVNRAAQTSAATSEVATRQLHPRSQPATGGFIQKKCAELQAGGNLPCLRRVVFDVRWKFLDPLGNSWKNMEQ